MDKSDKVSTGLLGFDKAVDKLRLGDNVVWQVDEVSIIRKWLNPMLHKLE